MAVASTNWRPSKIEAITELFQQAGARQYAQQIADDYYQQAQTYLQQFNTTNYEALTQLQGFMEALRTREQ